MERTSFSPQIMEVASGESQNEQHQAVSELESQPEPEPEPEREPEPEPQPEPRLEPQHQPESIPSWRTYNGPKLYVKPKMRNSNAQIIHKAVAKALEGAADAITLKKIKETIDSNQGSCGHFLILFRNNKFKGLYDYNSKLETISKLDGIGPKAVNVDDIVRFYKYDLSKRQFVHVETKHIGPTIIGFSLANSKPRQ